MKEFDRTFIDYDDAALERLKLLCAEQIEALIQSQVCTSCDLQGGEVLHAKRLNGARITPADFRGWIQNNFLREGYP
jgi:hypothetical protein